MDETDLVVSLVLKFTLACGNLSLPNSIIRMRTPTPGLITKTQGTSISVGH
jgi:hypothetical protein